jgi:hypothetical protein
MAEKPMGLPAIPSRAPQASRTAVSISCAWFACTTMTVGQGRAPIQSRNSASMRSGSTIGRRVWRRSRVIWGRARNASVSSASFEVDRLSGSPPERMTSVTESSAAIAARACSTPAVVAPLSA